jgi:hypothetical protein
MQGGDPLVERFRAARQQLVGLLVQGGERRRRPGERLRVVGVPAAVVTAGSGAATAANQERYRGQREANCELWTRLGQFLDYNTYVRFVGAIADRTAESAGGSS